MMQVTMRSFVYYETDLVLPNRWRGFVLNYMVTVGGAGNPFLPFIRTIGGLWLWDSRSRFPGA